MPLPVPGFEIFFKQFHHPLFTVLRRKVRLDVSPNIRHLESLKIGFKDPDINGNNRGIKEGEVHLGR